MHLCIDCLCCNAINCVTIETRRWTADGNSFQFIACVVSVDIPMFHSIPTNCVQIQQFRFSSALNWWKSSRDTANGWIIPYRAAQTFHFYLVWCAWSVCSLVFLLRTFAPKLIERFQKDKHKVFSMFSPTASDAPVFIPKCPHSLLFAANAL